VGVLVDGNGTTSTTTALAAFVFTTVGPQHASQPKICQVVVHAVAWTLADVGPLDISRDRGLSDTGYAARAQRRARSPLLWRGQQGCRSSRFFGLNVAPPLHCLPRKFCRLIREGLERGRNRQELWMGSGRGSAFGGSIGRCVPPVGLEPTLDGF
jgi:hypothetical protein